MSEIIDALNWRYATKKFDSTKKVSEEHLQTILNAGRLSASSFGLQPWHFMVVTNPDIREQMKAVAYGQTQVTDASCVIVLTRKLDDHIALDDYIASTARIQGVPVEQLDGMKGYMAGAIGAKPADQVGEWMARQVYIPLGMMLLTAALLRVDGCPMEGFDPAGFDEILGLKAQGLTSLAMLTLGYRSTEDEAALRPKIRFTLDEAFTFVK
jgi:nitroreductase